MYKRTNLTFWLTIFAVFTALEPCEISVGKIIYVDKIAAGANDGSSWDDSYNFLQDALADANELEKPVEIRLAQGSYSPDQDKLNPEGTAEREATFQLVNGVALKGGYAGLGAMDPNARDEVLFETALAGDIRSTGFGGGNSYHIVTGSGTNETAILDGIIIAGGNADGPRLGEKPDYDYQLRYGAGLYNDAGSPTLINCVFTDNSAYMGGGGMYNANGSNPTLVDCIFNWNSAVDGCGIYNSNSNPILTGCVFNTNVAQNNGGGMYNEQSSPILADSTFIDNSGRCGGGIYNIESNPMLTDCTFITNTTLTIRSTDNSLSGGGGIYNDQSNPSLNNCIFTENSAYAALSNFGGAMCNSDKSNPSLNNCLFSANWSENYGGGIYNSESSPILTDCVFNGNWAEEYGGGMCNIQSDPTLTGCSLVWNWAAVVTSYHDSYPSGAGMYNEASSPILSGCVISGNYAEGDGSGIYNSGGGPELDNCIIAGNWTADFGGGAYNQAGNLTLTNCTFFGNIAYEGNALACDSPQQDSPGNVEMVNCILWDGGNEIWNNDDSIITITYSNIRGGFSGDGNIDSDPLFAQEGYWVDSYDPNIIVEPDDPNASWTDGDYHLRSQAGRWDPNGESWVTDDFTSSCVDAGDPYSPVAFESSPNGGIINMGAFGGMTEASKSPSGLNSKYGGGIGEPNNPYLIYTAEQMNTIGAEPNDWDKYFKLMADIDLQEYTAEQFNIIGTMREKFIGSFDGAGHTISNFMYSTANRNFIGLFSQVGGGARIKDVSLDNVVIEVEKGSSVGALVGFNSHGITSGCCVSGRILDGDNSGNLGLLMGFNSWGTVSSCSASGSVTGGTNVGSIGGLVGNNTYGDIQNCLAAATVSSGQGSTNIGGLIGYSEGGTVSKSCSVGNISGDTSLGGLVGYKKDGNITQCYAIGTVSGNSRLGGLVGRNDSGNINDCYATGGIDGDDAVGGLVGRNHKGSVSYCYAAGPVNGSSRLGGLIGNEDRGSYTCSFWDSETNPNLSGAGDIDPDPNDIVGKTTAEMQTTTTFIKAGWDFVDEIENGTEDVWWILEGQGYPRLAWELIESVFRVPTENSLEDKNPQKLSRSKGFK